MLADVGRLSVAGHFIKTVVMRGTYGKEHIC